jgi:hypothetical protein
LRRRAISDVFQEEISRLALDRLQIRAATVEDRIAGEVVVLSTSGPTPDSEELSEVAGALGGFSIPYRWAYADEPAVHA